MGHSPSCQWGKSTETLSRKVGKIPTMSNLWRERLVDLMGQKGFNMKSLSKAAGFGETFVRDILKRSQSPGIDRMKALADTLGTTVEWLLEDSGSESRSLQELKRVPFDDDNDNGWHDGWKASIPGGAAEIDVEAGAGEGSIGNVVQIKSGGIRSGHLVVDEWVVPHNHLGRSPQGVIFIPVKGTSMLPVLTPTDVVAVDTTVENVHNGEIYAIDEGGGPSVKRIYVNYEDDPITMDIISENTAVGRKQRIAESVRIIGRVIGKWSKM